MASMSEIKSQLQAALEQVNQAIGSIGSARDVGEMAIQAATSTTEDTSSAMPGEGLNQWQQAHERLEEALTLFQAGGNTFEQYMNTI